METMLKSMTPPISVKTEGEVAFIQSCIAGAVKERLTEEDVRHGKMVQLYCLSYRHESDSRDKTLRISAPRLAKTVKAVREHCTDSGYKYYSIWIDSLLLDGQQDPNAEWADRGLPPYALCYVVAVPSLNGGFAADLKRAWVKCEHQLAASARGLIVASTNLDAPPQCAAQGPWQRKGRAYLKRQGGNLSPKLALRNLAMMLCSSLLREAEVTYPEDVERLEDWAQKVMCSKWKPWVELKFLPQPVSSATEVAERGKRVKNLLHNVFKLEACNTLPRFTAALDVIECQTFMRPSPSVADRAISPGHDLVASLLFTPHLTVHDGLTAERVAKIDARCVGLVAHFMGTKLQRGLVVYYYEAMDGWPIILDVEMFVVSPHHTFLVGYRVVHSEKVRDAINLTQSTWLEKKMCANIIRVRALDTLNMWYCSLHLGLKAPSFNFARMETWRCTGRWHHPAVLHGNGLTPELCKQLFGVGLSC